MLYQPKPFDTAHVVLDSQIEALADMLAEHAHDVWAKHRIKECSEAVSSPENVNKQNPLLVPFAQLSESDKEFDRRAALEPIKRLQTLGWRFLPPKATVSTQSGESKGPALSSPEAGSDATPEASVSTPSGDPITLAIQAWKEKIEPAYQEADREAWNHQIVHAFCTVAAAFAGTVAVFLAIIQLSGYSVRFTPEGEMAAAMIAVLSVALGILSTRLARWLLYRYKAERLRSLGFQLLADAELWGRDSSLIQARLNRVVADVEEISSTSLRKLHRWLMRPPSPGLLAAPAFCSDDIAVDRLADYYLAERVLKQREFFRKRHYRLSLFDLLTRLFPPMIFFLSVTFAFLHFVFHLIAHRFDPSGKTPTAASLGIIGGVCTIFAATLPVVGAGVRTIRSAFEYGRNTLRYRAAHYALTSLANRLDRRHRKPDASRVMFCDIAFCEQLLEGELREWLRLMVEAEWYA